MKKLMIMACAVALAAVAQAATVSWSSGALYTAAGKDGGWSSTMVNAAGALVTMNVYLVDATTYASVSTMGQADLFAWAKGKTANYTAQNKNTSGTIIPAITASDTTLAASTKYYSVLTATYTDATYGDMYMAAAVEAETTSSGSKTVANIFGGASTLATGGVRDWQAAAVPEPTSGLLLLLGMASLALRRRRA